LPSETMIWQPEFTDKTLSRKPGAVQFLLFSLHKCRPLKQSGIFLPRNFNSVLRACSRFCDVFLPSTLRT
ncbi:hypothetical protein, partial [Shigella flexneri]|uniref:hypothetical protein n=1 Tax=Shigella flexneri TaxID=623 RepID=UPI003CE7EC0E